MGKNNLFKKLWTNWISRHKIINLGPYFTPYTIIYLKKTINLRSNTNTINILLENMDKKICDDGRKVFLEKKNFKIGATKQLITLSKLHTPTLIPT